MRTQRFKLLSGLLLFGIVPAFFLFSRTSADERGLYIPHPESPVAPGELVVQFRPNVPDEQRSAILRAHGASIEREMILDDFVVVNVPPAQRGELGAALSETGAVATVEEVAARVPAAIPNDPLYDSQWHLEVIGVEQAYDVSDGSGIIVGVIDTGVAYENRTDATGQYGAAQDLAAAGFVHPWDVFGADAHPNDDYGHGTHVAGTIAQKTNNGVAGAGIAPGGQVMPVKVCGPWPNPDQVYGCPPPDIADGITWAVDHGARVINISLAGGPSITEAEATALQRASDAGVVVVAASGNDRNAVLDYPAALPSVISVGAVTGSLTRADYSNYGTNQAGGLMDLVGPGGDINAPIFQQSYGACQQHPQIYTEFFFTPCAGTSMAAAHVSGVAALIRSEFPQLNVSQVRRTLQRCALDLGQDGQDPFYGYGLVQAGRSLRDLDADAVPDCIDDVTITPSPTEVPPQNACAASSSPTVFPTALPTGPTASPAPTGTPLVTATPNQTGPGQESSETSSASPTETPTGSPSDSGSPGVETPTATAEPSPTPTPTPTSPPTPSPSPSPTPEPACGDVDCSGQVNAVDSLGVMRWLAQNPPFAGCLGKGYVNCDGLLNQQDAVVILRYAAGLPLNLPAGCSGIG